MCIVVDTNSLAAVFNENSENHDAFAPISTWIRTGKGVLVYGGSTYKRELNKAPRYARLFKLFRDAGQAVTIRDQVVDQLETDVRSATSGTTCDDQHIIALVGASRCPLVCSVDRRSHKFLKDGSLYPKGCSRPRIYSSAAHARLLTPMKPAALINRD